MISTKVPVEVPAQVSTKVSTNVPATVYAKVPAKISAKVPVKVLVSSIWRSRIISSIKDIEQSYLGAICRESSPTCREQLWIRSLQSWL